MQRREFNEATLRLLVSACMGAAALRVSSAHAANLGAGEMTQGLKQMLEKGASAAVQLLGREDGFLNNPLVRIPLPAYLNDAAKLLRTFGQGKKIDELVTAMNRAAEQAVPQGVDVLTSAIKNMSVDDAQKIVQGGETSVTQFFASKTRSPLTEKFLPIVTETTQKVGAAQRYNDIAAKAPALLKGESARIETYVTGKTLDGLYTVIGQEEQKIRRDPVAAGSALLQKILGR